MMRRSRQSVAAIHGKAFKQCFNIPDIDYQNSLVLHGAFFGITFLL